MCYVGVTFNEWADFFNERADFFNEWVDRGKKNAHPKGVGDVVTRYDTSLF